MAPVAATPLPYTSEAVKLVQLQTRDESTDTPMRGNRPYSIPPELAAAAKIVSESTSNTPSGNHKGDGLTDDTEAINRAISDGGRCGENCGSSTRFPAIVWFPGGKYLVSSSIIQYYNTQFIGDVSISPHLI